MGLKGYRLWGMGKLDSTCGAPPREAVDPVQQGAGWRTGERLVAAVQVQVVNLKAIFKSLGFRV
jgi:hypothetical protein